MSKEEQFVNELIGYIFAYPDDDYMTMECLCRKLHKHGLIEKKSGEWTADFIDRETEPQIRCPKCGRTDYIKNLEKDFGVKDDIFKYKCINCNTYIKDEPTISKMEQVGKDINVRSKDEPQTEVDKYREKIRPHDPHKY